MRRYLFVAAITAAVLIVPGAAAAGGSGKQFAQKRTAGFYEVRSGALLSRTVAPAGFYDFGGAETLGEPDVAFVVPFGQRAKMPASVRGLPLVRSIERPAGQPNDFDRGTVVIYGPDVSLLIPRRGAGENAGRRGGVAQTSADEHGCDDNYFCLYACSGFDQGSPQCTKVQFGPYFTGGGWQRLGDFGFNDAASSVRNRRNFDSLLARDWPPGNSTQHCVESHFADAHLSDNSIGEHSASSFANVPDDVHC